MKLAGAPVEDAVLDDPGCSLGVTVQTAYCGTILFRLLLAMDPPAQACPALLPSTHMALVFFDSVSTHPLGFSVAFSRLPPDLLR